MAATPEQQNAIAGDLQLRRWAPETLNYLRQLGFKVDPNATLAQNIAPNRPDLRLHRGRSLTSVPGVVHPPHTLTPPTAGEPYTSAAVDAGQSSRAPPLPQIEPLAETVHPPAADQG